MTESIKFLLCKHGNLSVDSYCNPYTKTGVVVYTWNPRVGR